MNIKRLAMIIFSLFILFPSVVLSATEQDSAFDVEAKAPAGPVAEVSTVSQLATLAATNKDALMFIAAARILQTVGAQPKPQQKKTQDGVDSSKQASGVDLLSVEYLLAQASELAGENKHLLALIEETSALKNRGRVGGPGIHHDRVRAGATDIFQVKFKSNERAEVYIQGDGDTDLDLYVYDKYGNLGCKDTDRSDRMYCSWVPRKTSRFIIKIKNLGGVYNQYVFITK